MVLLVKLERIGWLFLRKITQGRMACLAKLQRAGWRSYQSNLRKGAFSLQRRTCLDGFLSKITKYTKVTQVRVAPYIKIAQGRMAFLTKLHKVGWPFW